MKKHLFTCFLASLCLYGSSLLAQVADSPGADFLHRSQPQVSTDYGDTHRGGETRSDTLPEQNGLVDHSGLPAEDRTAYISVLDEEVGLPADNRIAKLAVNDHVAGAKGQEGESSSASMGEAAPAVIYVETLSLEPIDSLEFRLWDPYLNELGMPKPYTEIVPLNKGSMFEGSRGATNTQWNSPSLANFARLSLRNKKVTLLVLFSGPDADKFRLQYDLATMMENDEYDQNPIMFTANSDFWGYSEEDSLKIAHIKKNQSSIRRSMEYLAPDESGLRYLKQKFSGYLNSHPAFDLISRYRDRLPQDFLQVLEADIMGILQYGQVSDFSVLSTGVDSLYGYKQLYRDEIAPPIKWMPEGAEWSAYYPEFLYQKLVIISVMEQEPLRNLLSSLPVAVRDLVDAKSLLLGYTR